MSEFLIQPSPDFVPHSTKLGHQLFFGAGRVERVIKRPVPAFHGGGKCGAIFVCCGTHTDHDVGRSSFRWKEFKNRFAHLRRDINSQFRHDRDSSRMHISGGFCSGRECFVSISVVTSEQTFRHLTAAGIASAQEQDSFSLRHRKVSEGRSTNADLQTVRQIPRPRSSESFPCRRIRENSEGSP